MNMRTDIKDALAVNDDRAFQMACNKGPEEAQTPTIVPDSEDDEAVWRWVCLNAPLNKEQIAQLMSKKRLT